MQNTNKKVDKIYAFIDSQNLNLGVKAAGWTLDFGKFRTYLKDKYNVEKAYLFIGHVSGNEKLYTYLQEVGYILVFKPTLEYSKGEEKFIKGNVDAELVLHTMLHISEYKKAVVVTGDGDFYCLVEYLKDKGRLGKIITPNQKYSSLFRKYAEHIVSVPSFRKKVEVTPRKKRTKT